MALEMEPTFCPLTDVENDMGTVAVMIVIGLIVGLVAFGTSKDFILWL